MEESNIERSLLPGTYSPKGLRCFLSIFNVFPQVLQHNAEMFVFLQMLTFGFWNSRRRRRLRCLCYLRCHTHARLADPTLTRHNHAPRNEIRPTDMFFRPMNRVFLRCFNIKPGGFCSYRCSLLEPTFPDAAAASAAFATAAAARAHDLQIPP